MEVTLILISDLTQVSSLKVKSVNSRPQTGNRLSLFPESSPWRLAWPCAVRAATSVLASGGDLASGGRAQPGAVRAESRAENEGRRRRPRSASATRGVSLDAPPQA